jgi:peptidoglycan hydrolase FlgJ
MQVAIPSSPPDIDRLRTAAAALEAGFLAEMLKAAGLGQPPSGFGGGVGESQFASLMVEAQAQAMVAAGGIGLTEHLFDSLTRGAADDAG